MLNNRASKIGAILLALFFVLTYLFPLNSRLLWQPDETRYAEISREMVVSGNWIVPHMLDIRYFEKPVAGYWINNVSQLIFGHTNFAVRFGSVISILLSTLLVYLLARMMWRNRQVAFVSSLIYLSMFLVFSVGTYSVLDPMLALWVTASMVCCFWALKATTVKTRILAWITLGLACGMAFMTKGFLALAIPVIVMIPITLYQKQFTQMLLYGLLAVFSAALISLPWVLAIAKAEPDYWHYFFWVEHIQRFSGEDAQHSSPFWYYIPVVLLGVIPWLGLLPGALMGAWKKRRKRPELFFLLCWFVVPFLFFSIAKGKLPTYMLPFMAPLAMLMAKYGVDCARKFRMKALRINGYINIFIGVAVVIAILVIQLVSSKPIYMPYEWSKWVLAIVAFSLWGIIGYLCSTLNGKHWLWAASCSLGVSLCIGQAIPNSSVDGKLPQEFIRQNIETLNASKYIVSNSVGVGAGLAWELQRSDIYLYERTGELTYGVEEYPDSHHKLIKPDNFAQWLEEARKEGNVSVVITFKDPKKLAQLPRPEELVTNHRIAILTYEKRN